MLTGYLSDMLAGPLHTQTDKLKACRTLLFSDLPGFFESMSCLPVPAMKYQGRRA